jgi:N-acyl-D-amino-acid deacylase
MSYFLTRVMLISVIIGTLAGASSAVAQNYDIAIMSGRVIDPETMLDATRNVGIKNGRIAVITTERISGRETIDATGLVIAPGFIDTQFHGLDPFAVKMALRDGTTSTLDLEVGALKVKDWYDQKARNGWQTNYGVTAGMPMIRMQVHDPELTFTGPVEYTNAFGYINQAAKDGVPGWSVTRSNIAQMNRIMKILDDELRDGAIGVGIPINYMTEGLTSYEVFEAQRVAGRYGRLTDVHLRYHGISQTPMESPISFAEIFTNAALVGAPLLVAHNNNWGWWEIEEKLQMARAKGLNMWSEYYPYDASFTIVSSPALRPEIWEKVRGYKYEETLFDPFSSKFLDKAAYQEMVKKNPGHLVIAFVPEREKWIPYWLTMPQMTVASDGASGRGLDNKLLPWDADYTKYVGHPRTTGSRAKVLRLAREQGVPLMFTIAQLSYWSAKHLGDAGLESMKERGRVQVGKVADLTLFDPKTVSDNATYKLGESGLPSTGIPYVLVNGTIVVKDSTVLPAKPGQPIRYPVEEKGRFEPVSIQKWTDEHTIGTRGMPNLNDEESW